MGKDPTRITLGYPVPTYPPLIPVAWDLTWIREIDGILEGATDLSGATFLAYPYLKQSTVGAPPPVKGRKFIS